MSVSVRPRYSRLKRALLKRFSFAFIFRVTSNNTNEHQRIILDATSKIRWDGDQQEPSGGPTEFYLAVVCR